jgi:hypothetical protein
MNVNNNIIQCSKLCGFIATLSRRDRTKVARHFSPWNKFQNGFVPEGRYDLMCSVCSPWAERTLAAPDHTVPYGTDLYRPIPGNKLPATFTASLRDNGVCERKEPWEPGAYLIAPIVSPRTNCLETMILNMMTGRAIMVPVAMICPQGKS